MNKTSFPLRRDYALMNEADAGDFIDLNRLWTIVRRQLWILAFCALVGLGLGYAYLLATPPSFTAQTQILFDENLSASTGDTTSVATNVQTDSAILSRIEVLKSTRLALVVVDKEGLADNANFMNPPPSALSRVLEPVRAAIGSLRGRAAEPAARTTQAGVPDPTAERRGRAADLLREKLFVDRVGRSYVITLSNTSHDPDLAFRITRAYTEAFLADQLIANENASGEATEWMQARLVGLGDQQRQAALDVERFRAENGLSEAGGQLTADQRLSQLTAQLVVVQGEFAAAKARSQQFDAIIEGGVAKAIESAALPNDLDADTVVSTLRPRYLDMSRRLKEVVDRWGSDHPQAVSLRREQAEVSRQLFGELQRLATQYHNALDIAGTRQKALSDTIAEQTRLNATSNQSLVRLRELEQHSDILKTIYGKMLARYEDVLQKQAAPISTMRVITEPTLPESPSGPRFASTMAFSLMLGLLTGCLAGALNEFNERFFRVGAEIRKELGLKFLGYLPEIRKTSKLVRGQRTSPTEQRLHTTSSAFASSFAETLRNVKIAVNAALSDTRSKVVGIVSALPDEGKSTFAANFAELLALNGFKTVLIDADMRRPGLTKLLFPGAKVGLIDATLGLPWQEVARLDERTKFQFIPSVAAAGFAFGSEVLSSPGMQKLIEDLRSEFDYIIVDLPPAGPVVDAKAFEPLVDGFLLVVQWGRTPRALLRSILSAEPEIAQKIVGAILNRTDVDALAKYGARGGEEEAHKSYRKYYVGRA